MITATDLGTSDAGSRTPSRRGDGYEAAPLACGHRRVRQTGDMSEPTPPRSGKAAAAAAAKTLLADRIALVNTLGDALDVHRKQDAAATQARDAEHQAAEAARTAYASALAGGWAAKQLSDAGLRPPKAPRTRKPHHEHTPVRGENTHPPAEYAAPAVG